MSKQKKKIQKEKEEKTKLKKSTAKKNQQVSSPKEEEKIRYAKGPDNSSQGFERKVTVSPKPSKEKYRAPMRRYGYFTSPNLFFRGSSIFRETHDINNRRTSSRISRHPFPGPGLAIRMPGQITKEKIKILKEADHYFINELKKENLYNKIWQAYAALLPVKTVGVMGDNRTYDYICLLRAITSSDGMTADYFDFPKKFMQNVSNKIINNIKGINRVVYDVTSKPPSTIELE